MKEHTRLTRPYDVWRAVAASAVQQRMWRKSVGLCWCLQDLCAKGRISGRTYVAEERRLDALVKRVWEETRSRWHPYGWDFDQEGQAARQAACWELGRPTRVVRARPVKKVAKKKAVKKGRRRG